MNGLIHEWIDVSLFVIYMAIYLTALFGVCFGLIAIGIIIAEKICNIKNEVILLIVRILAVSFGFICVTLVLTIILRFSI